MNPKDGLIIYCGYFLIKAEGGAKNYKRDLRLTVSLAILYLRFSAAKGVLGVLRVLQAPRKPYSFTIV